MKRRLLFITFLGALLAIIILQIIDFKLSDGDFNFGIISFELAGNLVTSNIIIRHWAEIDVLHLAAFSLGFDYFFILFYVSFLALWTAVISEYFYSKAALRLANLFIVLLIIAGVLDSIENASLLINLGNNASEYYANLAANCAKVKFIFIGLAIIFNISVSFKRLIVRR